MNVLIAFLLAGFPFHPGETLIYDVKFGPFGAGEMQLRVLEMENIRGHLSYHFEMTAKTQGAVSWIFKIDDHIQSHVDALEFASLRYDKNLHEGRYKAHKWMEFHPEDSTVRYSDGKESPYEIGALDPLSVVYYARTQPLSVGDTLNVPYHPGEKSVRLNISVLEIDTVKAPLGKFECLIVRPESEGENLFKGKGSMKVWYSNDSLRIPVKIWTKVSFGSLTGVLREYRRPKPRGSEGFDTIKRTTR